MIATQYQSIWHFMPNGISTIKSRILHSKPEVENGQREDDTERKENTPGDV